MSIKEKVEDLKGMSDHAWLRQYGPVLAIGGIFIAVLWVLARFGGAFLEESGRQAAVLPRMSTHGAPFNEASGPPQVPSAREPSSAPESGAQATPETEEARIAINAPAFSSLSAIDFFDRWYADKITSLQRAEFKREMTNKTVIWSGAVEKVEEGDRDNMIRVVAMAQGGRYSSFFLDFAAPERPALLTLAPGDKIRVTGVIIDIVGGSPFLESCRLLRVERP